MGQMPANSAAARWLSMALAAVLTFQISAAFSEMLPGPIQAHVIRVLDGDTFLAEVHVWFGQTLVERVRIAGIDAPEIGRHARCEREAEAAERARQYLAGLLGRETVELHQVRREKYGRALATVSVQGIDVTTRMIETRHARPYSGGRRLGWCE